MTPDEPKTQSDASEDASRSDSDPPSDEALRRHREACRRGEYGYRDPETDLFVMTSVYLRDQGDCCGSGCRHCPWPEERQRRAGRPEEAPRWPWREDEEA